MSNLSHQPASVEKAEVRRRFTRYRLHGTIDSLFGEPSLGVFGGKAQTLPQPDS
jgi:hypothetical protein